ncbi:hypothetical protein A6C57_00990 [Fibrella sp. ES10-3-2-2]|nr:hypothetical protein A6C57_00990 [Fibrella sp. ES10-3-2-2]
MTIFIESTADTFRYNFSRTPQAGRGYSCSSKRLHTYTLVQQMGRAANGSACIERGVALREGQVKKLIRKHLNQRGYKPRPRSGYLTFYI